VKLDALQAANAERGEAVFMLEPAVLALHGLPSGVEVTEAPFVPLDSGLNRDGEAVALHAFGVDAVRVVGLVSGDSLGR
jgi:hypothetical protein